MKNMMLKTLCATALLSANLQFSQAQGVWSTVKEKARSAWNSDTRKNAWEKTKELYNEGKDSELSKKAMESLDEHRYTVPVKKRKFLNVIPDSYILSLSKEQYRSYLNSSRKSTNQAHIAQVKRVANRLSQAVRRLYIQNGLQSELANYEWEFNVVQNSDANAFCMPGGKIVVFDGILPIAGSDDALAVVMGHEIGHAIAKHSAEQMTDRVIEVGGLLLAYSIISGSDMSNTKKKLASIIAAAGVTLLDLMFSRMNETEADRLGLILTAMAGYDPGTAVGFWQRMGEKSINKSTHDWYSTHPSNTNRINDIKSMLPEARRYANK